MNVTPGTLPTNLAELIAALAALPSLPPVERARRARALDRASRAIIGEVGDEATFQALHEIVDRRTRTYDELAELLGVSRTRINSAVTQYRRKRDTSD